MAQSRRRLALLALGCALLLRLSPMSVYNATVLLLGNTCGWAWQTMRAVPAQPPPLKAAILNVTSDFDQLATLLRDFFEQPGADPQVEACFKAFLATRAAKSYPRVESVLDWLLAVYKFVFPFLLISMAAKRSGGGRGEAAGGGQAAGEGEAAGEAAACGDAGGAWLRLEPALARSDSHQHTNGSALGRAVSGRAGSTTAAGPHPGHLLLASGGGSGSARAGSQSPNGPDTPVEGACVGGRLPQHPATRLGSGAKSPRQRQRLATASELIDAEYSF